MLVQFGELRRPQFEMWVLFRKLKKSLPRLFFGIPVSTPSSMSEAGTETTFFGFQRVVFLAATN